MQVANVAIADARSITITPYEKTMVGPVEKAILASDLGLTPTTVGTVIRINLPPLTEERRKELSKHVAHEGENAKVAVRNVRRDALHHVKELLKDKKITEDENAAPRTTSRSSPTSSSRKSTASSSQGRRADGAVSAPPTDPTSRTVRSRSRPQRSAPHRDRHGRQRALGRDSAGVRAASAIAKARKPCAVRSSSACAAASRR